MPLTPWPYPALFAHRGGGRLAPENTLAGMVKAAEMGFSAVEFDVKLTQDNLAILMHDDTLERTTNGDGLVAHMSYAQLAGLDAGSWFGAEFAQIPIPTFGEVALYCRNHDLAANVEIKPCPGRERETGAQVAREAARWWQGQALQPLLSSFSFEALQAAHEAVPELPVGWLVETWPDDWEERLAEINCVSFHCDHHLLDAARVRLIKDAGYRVLAYTVNDVARASELLYWGVDGLFTDALDTLPLGIAPR